MILDIEFKYGAQVRLRRRSGSEHAAFLANATFAIRDVDGDAAPIAMWWTPTDRVDLHGHQVAVRHMEASLWQPVCGRKYVSRKLIDGRVLPLTPLAGGTSGEGKCFRAGPTRRSDASGPATTTREAFLAATRGAPFFAGLADEALGRSDDALKVAQVLGDHRTLVEAEIANHLEALAVIDGTLHERIGMPTLKTGVRSGSSTLRTEEVESYRFDDGPHDEYRMERFDHVASGHPDEAMVAALRPEILIPAAFEFDEEEHVVRGAAERVVRAMTREYTNSGPYGSSVLARYPDNVVFAYVDLRDALASGACVEDIMRLGSAYAETLCPHGTLSGEMLRMREAVARVERDRASYFDEASLLRGAACA